jgi:hypothetical protein
MTKHVLEEHELNLIELSLFLEQCNQLAAENDQVLMRLRVLQDWLADLERRAEKLSDRVRMQKH